MYVMVENLNYSYQNTQVLHDISFGLNKGEVTGLIGSNGAGKTTILKTMIRKLKPESGRITIDHENLTTIKNEMFPVTFVPDEPIYYEELTVLEHLQFVKALYPDGRVSVEKMIEQFGLNKHLYKIPGSLSKGTLQKLMIALALLRVFDVFLADEPFNGLDPSQIHGLKKVLQELKQQGKAVLISTHLLDMAEGFCDRYVFLHNGRVLAYGSKGEIINNCHFPQDYSLEQIYIALIREDEEGEYI